MDTTTAMRRRARARLLCLLALLLVAALVYAFPSVSSDREKEGLLQVSFLDVGQGDAIFIKAPGGGTMLIDAGPDGSAVRELARELGFFGRTLDAVLLTHEDQDHVGGMEDIFLKYDVRSFIRTENQGDGGAAKRIEAVVEEEGSQLYYARRDMRFSIGDGVFLEILYPVGDPSELPTNTSSIVARLVYGETEFMLTGDSPSSIEAYLTKSDPVILRSDVLKAGHHGSKTSTLPEFVQAVAPSYAVISAGQDNRYGHPHAGVLATLDEAGVEVLSTADQGTITFLSDGKELWQK